MSNRCIEDLGTSSGEPHLSYRITRPGFYRGDLEYRRLSFWRIWSDESSTPQLKCLLDGSRSRLVAISGLLPPDEIASR